MPKVGKTLLGGTKGIQKYKDETGFLTQLS